MSNRDMLRSLTLGAPPRQMRKRLVTLRDASQPRRPEDELDEEGQPVLEQATDGNGEQLFDETGKPVMRTKQRYRHPPLLLQDGKLAQVEVREPGIKQRAAIYRAAGVSAAGEESKFDMAQLQVETVVALTYEPGTNIKIYSEADKPALLAQLAGGFVDDIFEVAQPLMNSAKEQDVEKNSKGTASV